VSGPDRPLLEVGHVAKAHGIRGEVVVDLITDVAERVDAGAHLSTNRGELVVASSRPFGHRWLVNFEGVTDRDTAEGLAGLVLRAPAIEDPAALWVHDLVGCEVVEQDGRGRGRVEAVQANPASDLLVLEGGALVPVIFIVESAPGRVVIDPPAGLFE
jgi:16S rRNA processing protein RimM